MSIFLVKKVLKEMMWCTVLQKQPGREEDADLDQTCLNATDTFLMCVGVTSLSFYHEMPYMVNQFGYVIFFPLLLSGVMTLIITSTYAELISVNANSGGIYRYVYGSMGELMGFLTGWNVLYNSILRVSFCIWILTSTIDVIFFDGKSTTFCEEHFYMGGNKNNAVFLLPFAHLHHIFALVIIIVATSFPVRYAKINVNSISVLNIMAVIACLSIFWFYMDLTKFDILNEGNEAYFIKGCMKSTMFYFELEAPLYAGSETINPTVAIPHGLLGGFQWGFSIYIVSVILYSIREEGDSTNEKLIPMTMVLRQLGFRTLSILPAIGQCFCSIMSMVARLFVLSRLLHRMSRDGLMFHWFGIVNPRLKIPLVAHLVVGGIIGFIVTFIGVQGSTFTSLTGLACINRISTLISHLVTRYRCEYPEEHRDPGERWMLINYPKPVKSPTKTTHTLSMLLILVAVLAVLSTLIILIVFIIARDQKSVALKMGFIFSLLILLVVVQLLSLQPQNDRRHFLYVLRGAPFTSFMAITWNMSVMLFLATEAWVKMLTWLLIGTIFYYCFACRRSTEFIKTVNEDMRRTSI